MDPLWRIELFGWLRAVHADRIITRFSTRKTAALLAYLAFYRQRVHRRDELAACFWPEGDPEAGRRSLRVALSSLRHQLEPPGVIPGSVLRTEGDAVQLSPAACETDVAQFEAAVQASARARESAERVQQLEAAVALYRGELLPGCLEEWVLPEQQRLSELFFQAVAELIHRLEEREEVGRALQHALRAVAVDPLREEAHEEVIRLLAAAGRPEAALRQYQELERMLQGIDGSTPAAVPPPLTPPSSSRSCGGLGVRGQAPGEGLGAKGQGSSEGLGVRGQGSVPTPVSAPFLPPDPLSRVSCLPHRSGRGENTPLTPAKPLTPPVPPLRPPAHTPAAHAGHLPLRLTRFFGREAEIACLQELLGQGVEGWALGLGSGVGPPNAQCPTPNARLVTLTGPGGSGKTRLALEVADRLWDRFQGAIWFVPLADVDRASQMPDKIREVLHLPHSPQREPLQHVAAFLSRQPALLVLDNLEHLGTEAAALVHSLLEQAPTLTCIVTSRRRLNLAEEHEVSVSPLPVPSDFGFWMLDFGLPTSRKARPSDDLHFVDPIQNPTSKIQNPEALMQFPSVQLFIDRARAVRPEFQLTPDNAPAVAGLCRRLEGLPLALELAAARSSVLAPAQILARLDRRLELLTSRQSDVDARHRSLRATLDWSYRLLSPELQQFFDSLSLFRGGWTLAAAEVVFDEPAARAYLRELRERSLVLAEEATGVQAFRRSGSIHRDEQDEQDGIGLDKNRDPVHPGKPSPASHVPDPVNAGAESEPLDARTPERRNARTRERVPAELRFRLLETVREYAAEQLGPEEQRELARRHAHYFLGLAEQAEPALHGPAQGEWLARLEQEQDNLRAALAWAAAAGERLIGLRLGGALGFFWYTRGYWTEGRDWIARLLALDHAESCEPGAARAKALDRAARLAESQGDLEAARAQAEESLAIGRRVAGSPIIANSLQMLGRLAARQGNHSTARALYEEGLVVARSCGDLPATAHLLHCLAYLLDDQGEEALVHSLRRECLEIYRQLDDRHGIAEALSSLGKVAYLRGDYAAARSLYEECLAVCRDLCDSYGTALILLGLGEVLRCQREYTAAGPLYEESLALFRELGDQWSIAGLLSNLGHVWLNQGDHRRAASFFAEGLALCRKLASQNEKTPAVAGTAIRFGAICLGGLAGAFGAAGRPEQAARWFGTAEALREAVKAHLWPADRVDQERQVAAVRAALGEAAFAAGWAEGRAMLPEEAVAAALREAAQL